MEIIKLLAVFAVIVIVLKLKKPCLPPVWLLFAATSCKGALATIYRQKKRLL